MRTYTGLLAAFLALILTGCSAKKPPEPTYGVKAISITFTSAPDINSYEGTAHSVALTVYQLTVPDAFNKLAQTPDGLRQLLGGSAADKTIVAANTYIVMPGQSRQIVLDRLKSTTWIGITAGFFTAPSSQDAIVTFPIPVHKPGWYAFWDGSDTYEPLDLNLKINKSSIHGEPVQ